MSEPIIEQIHRSNRETERVARALLVIDLLVGLLWLISTNDKSLAAIAMPRQLFGGLMFGTALVALAANLLRGELAARIAILAVASVWVSFVIAYSYHRTFERGAFLTLIVATVLIGHLRPVVGTNAVTHANGRPPV